MSKYNLQSLRPSMPRRQPSGRLVAVVTGRFFVDAPASCVVPSLDVAFLFKAGKQSLYGQLVNAELLTQAADRDGWLRLHDPKNLCIVGCTELYPLTVVPPDILVRLRQEAGVIVDFLCNQGREITEEGTDLVKLRVRSDAWC